jgi:hypothetical protein
MELSREAQNCEVRIARTAEEKAAVYRLRYEAYVEERGIVSQYADHERRWIKDPLDENGLVLVAVSGGSVAGTIRLNCARNGPLEFEHEYLLDRFRPYYPEAVSTTTKFIISAKHRKSRVAMRLAQEQFVIAKELGIVFDFINVDNEMVVFYEKFGYRLYGPKFCHPEFGLVPTMILVLDDAEHFRRVGSPLYGVAATCPPDGDSVDFFRRLALDGDR